MADVRFAIDGSQAVEGFRAITQAARDMGEGVSNAARALSDAQQSMSSRGRGAGRDPAAEAAASQQRAAEAAARAEEESTRRANEAVIADRVRRDRELSREDGRLQREREAAIQSEVDFTRRANETILADRIRAGREASREEARRLRERESATRSEEQAKLRQQRAEDASARAAEAAARRAAAAAGGRVRATVQLVKLEEDLAKAVQGGALSQAAANRIRTAATANIHAQSVASRGLLAEIQQLNRSFAVLAFGPLSGVGARLITVQAGLEGVSRVLSGATSAGGRISLLASVVALGGAFTALGASLIVGSKLVQAAQEFEQVNATLVSGTGSLQGAADAYRFVREQADRLGLPLRESAVQFSKLAATGRAAGFSLDSVKTIFLGVAEAATALNLSNEEISGSLVAVQQIMSKGTVSMEELKRQLGQRLPVAMAYAAQSMHKTTQELDKLVASGKLTAKEFLEPFAVALQQGLGENATRAAQTLTHQINRLHNAILEMFTDASQGGFSDAISQAISRLTEAIKDPDFQKGMTNFANLLGVVAERLARIDFAKLNTLALTIAGATPGILTGNPLLAAGGATAGFGAGVALEQAGQAHAYADALNSVDEAAISVQAALQNIDEKGLLVGAWDDAEKSLRLLGVQYAILLEQTSKPVFSEQSIAVQEVARKKLDDIRAAMERLKGITAQLPGTADEARKALAALPAGTYTGFEGASKALDDLITKMREATSGGHQYQAALEVINKALETHVIDEKQANILRTQAAELWDKNTIAAGKYADQLAQVVGRIVAANLETQEQIDALNKQIDIRQSGTSIQQQAADLKELNIELEIERKNRADLANLYATYQGPREDLGQIIIDTERLNEQYVRTKYALADIVEASQAAQRAQEELSRQAQREFEQPFRTAAKNIQNTFADMFSQIFQNGVASFKDLGKRILSVFADAAAQLVTLFIFRPEDTLSRLQSAGGLGNLLGGISPPGQARAPDQTTNLLTGIQESLAIVGKKVDQSTSTLGGINVAGWRDAETQAAQQTAVQKSMLDKIIGLAPAIATALGGVLGGLAAGGGGFGALAGSALGTILGSALGLGPFGGVLGGFAGGGLEHLIGLAGAHSPALGALTGLFGGIGAIGATLAVLPTLLTTLTSLTGVLTPLTTTLGTIGGYTIGATVGASVAAGTAGGTAGGGAAAGGATGGSLGGVATGGLVGVAVAVVALAILAGLGAFDEIRFRANVKTVTKQNMDKYIDEFTAGITQETPFGVIGIVQESSKHISEAFVQYLLNTIRKIDTQIALALRNQEEVDLVAQALQTPELGPDAQHLLAHPEKYAQTTSSKKKVLFFAELPRLAEVLQALAGVQAARDFDAFAKGITAKERKTTGVSTLVDYVTNFINTRNQLADALDQLQILAKDKLDPTDIENTFKQIDDIVRTLQYQAADFGIDTGDLQLLAEKAKEAARQNFVDQINLAILGITDPLAQALYSLAEEEKTLLREAEAAGKGRLEVETLYAKKREEALKQANQAIQDALDQQKFGTSSPLSAETRLFEAQTKFNETFTSILAGTAGGTGRQDLVDAFQNALAAATDLFGATAPFFNVQTQLSEKMQQIIDFIPDVTDLATAVDNSSLADLTDITNQNLVELGSELASGNATQQAQMDELINEVRMLRAAQEQAQAATARATDRLGALAA